MDIYNNDDCNIDIVNLTETAIELTKLYYEHKTSNMSVSQDDIFKTYEYYKKQLKKLEEKEKYGG